MNPGDTRPAGSLPDAQEVGIREMTPDDYQAVTGLWAEAGLPYRPLGRDRPERMRLEMERGTAVFLVAEAGDRLVGVVLGTHDGRRGWINRLAVAPGYRRRGIASSLVSEVERRVGELGIEIVAALIESENDASLGFFGAIGYLHGADIEYVSKRRSADT
jgi:ribosomal protein S18 acetylase RimI-like enzyme